MIRKGSNPPYFGNTREPSPCFSFIDVENMRSGLGQLIKSLDFDDKENLFDLMRLFGMFHCDRHVAYSAVPKGEEADHFIKRMRGSSKYIFRSGILTQNGRRRKQQGVDVLLATDALKHAYLKNMRAAILFSGDGDFLPLLNSLVDAGIIVTVVSFGNPEKSEVAAALRDSADHYYEIGSAILSNMLSEHHMWTSSGSQENWSIQEKGHIEHREICGRSIQIVVQFDGQWTLIHTDEDITLLSNTAMLDNTVFRSYEGLEAWAKLNEKA